MTKLILVRHGHVEGISPERFRGRVRLAAAGVSQGQLGTAAEPRRRDALDMAVTDEDQFGHVPELTSFTAGLARPGGFAKVAR